MVNQARVIVEQSRVTNTFVIRRHDGLSINHIRDITHTLIRKPHFNRAHVIYEREKERML